MIPYGRQTISDDDIKAVVDVLQSDFLTQGPAVPLFEKTVSQYCNSQYAVAANSATSALHLACQALGLKAGDSIWTTPITFVATANCGLYCGARVDFVDIDPETYNLSATALKKKLEDTVNSGHPLPKIVIPVHLCGQPCDMKAIHQLSAKYGFKIIEDASHAIGGRYKNNPVGNCHYSDITIFSFHPVKIITSAEGGMAVTNNPELADKMSLLRSHGITRDANKMTHLPDGEWYYQQVELGYNYRMTDIQAALGCSQMQRLDQFVEKRHVLAKRYTELLKETGIICPYQHPNSYSAFHLYVIRLSDAILKGYSHKHIFEALRKKGIGVNLHYIPVHTQPWYQQFGFKKGDFPEAERYYQEAITLPLYPTLTTNEQDYIIKTVEKVLS